VQNLLYIQSHPFIRRETARNDMEIKQLKAFLAIAETRTFTAGAKKLSLTQAAISMQIRQLEEQVGAQLFTRTPRRVILTEAGEMLLPRARAILREHDAAIAEIKELKGAERGRLRIGSASGEFAAVQLPSILHGLVTAFPHAEISVAAATSHALIDRITHGELDIAFVSLPVDNPLVETQVVLADKLAAIVHPQHPFAKLRSVTAEKLAAESLILGEKGGNTRRMIDAFFQMKGVKPNVAMELSRQEAVTQMVEKGLGVGIAGAKSAAGEVRSGRLATCSIEDAELKLELGLARLRGGHVSPIAEEFVRLCVASFAEREKEMKARR
jgi:DNA-binding transcriptional LysR family regulator